MPWDLVCRAVATVCDLPWVMLYVRRWLKAPAQQGDGTLTERWRGTPQGSAVSPVVANLFMHYALDAWLARNFAGVVFERYADDVVIHCKSLEQAQAVLAAVAERMRQVGLMLHPRKTRIVYCKDANRTGSWEHTEFTFLGYEFRERTVKGRHGLFRSFSPAVSRAALKRMSATVRSWRLHRWVTATVSDLAAHVNPVVRGWMRYYGAFHPSALYPCSGESTPTWSGGSGESTADCGPAGPQPCGSGTQASRKRQATSHTGPGLPSLVPCGDTRTTRAV